VELERKANERHVSMPPSPRWFGLRGAAFGEIGGYLRPAEYEQVAERMKNAFQVGGLSESTLELMEAIMADTIRDVSKKYTTVGPNLMSITIPFPGLRRPRIRFLPAKDHTVVVSTPRTSENLIVYYTPWIIGSGILCPPSGEVGDSVVTCGNFEIEIRGAQPTGEIVGASLGQKRHEPPKA
jgi:hypothetical protein